MRRDPARCDARGRRRGTAPSLTRTAAGCCRSCTPRPGSAPAAAPPARRFFCAQSSRPQGWGAAGRVLRRAAPRTRPTFCAAPAAAARGARRERRSGGRAARGEEGGAGRDPARRGAEGAAAALGGRFSCRLEQMAAALLLYLPLLPGLAGAFNLDAENVIGRRGEPGSLFGFSLAMHRQLQPQEKRL